MKLSLDLLHLNIKMKYFMNMRTSRNFQKYLEEIYKLTHFILSI